MFPIYLIVIFITLMALIFHLKDMSKKIEELPDKITTNLIAYKADQIQNQIDELSNKLNSIENVEKKETEESNKKVGRSD